MGAASSIIGWLTGSVLPWIAGTVAPWVIGHPWLLAPLGLGWGGLSLWGSTLRANPDARSLLGPGITAAAWVVALVYLLKNWPTVSRFARKALTVALVVGWALVLWLRPSLRWGIGTATLFAGLVWAVVRWAEWTDGQWFSRTTYEECKRRDLRLASSAHAMRMLYPGAGVRTSKRRIAGRRTGYSVAVEPPYGSSVASMAHDADSGVVGNALARSSRKHGLREPPHRTSVMRDGHEGQGRLVVDVDEPTAIDRETPWPGYLVP